MIVWWAPKRWSVPAGRDDRLVGAEAVERAVLHAERDAANALTLLVHDEVHREILDEEQAVVLQRHAVQGVQDRVARAVGRRRAAVRLAAFPELQALAAERALVNL